MFAKFKSSRVSGEYALVLAAWLWVSWPLLRPGSHVFGFDTYAYTSPNLSRAFASWRGLKIPLWEQGFFGGVPFLGRLGAQGLYFVNVPFALLPVDTALELLTAFHLLVLAIGVMLWVRHGLHRSSLAGAVASISVLGSSFVAVKALSFDQLVAISWWPWILLSISWLISNPKNLRSVGCLSLFLTLLILGGHPQFIYMGFVLFGIYFILSARRLTDLKIYIAASVSVFIALCASSLQLISTYFLTRSSAMSGQRSLETLRNAAYVLPPSRSVVGLLGSPFGGDPTALTGTGEAVLGIGVVAVFLALVGLHDLWLTDRRRAVGMFMLSVFGLLMALGPRSSVFRFFYDALPGVGSARVPGRWLALLLIVVPYFASCGVDYLRSTGRRFWLWTTLTLWMIGVLLSQAGQLADVGLETIAWWSLVGFSIGALGLANSSERARSGLILIASLLAIQLIGPFRQMPTSSGSSKTSFLQSEPDLLRPVMESGGRVFAQTFDRFGDENYLVKSLRPNTNLLFGIESLDGYDGGMWVQRRWVNSVEALTTRPFNFDLTIRSQTLFPLKADLLARFGVRWLLLETEVASAAQLAPNWLGPVSTEGSLQLWENPSWKGTAVGYLNSRMAANGESHAEALNQIGQNTALVEDQALVLECGESCPLQQVGESYRTTETGGYVFEIAAPGILAIDRSWSKDWVVYLDGRRTSTFPVNGNFLGIKFDAGFHRVDYRYSPRWFQPALLLSVFGLLTIGLLISNRTSRRSTRIPVDSDK
jgi:hypothetical protein